MNLLRPEPDEPARHKAIRAAIWIAAILALAVLFYLATGWLGRQEVTG